MVVHLVAVTNMPPAKDKDAMDSATPPAGLDLKDQVYFHMHKAMMFNYRNGREPDAFAEAERLLLVCNMSRASYLRRVRY